MEFVPTSTTVELSAVLAFLDVAVDALADAAEEIDALNVYPVPDRDTGTNLHLTLAAGRDAARAAADTGGSRSQVLAALGRGALLGARGNSGVVLSEMLGALGRRIAASGPEERNATVVAEAFTAAVDASYAAVGQPVEGTMLTVARAAADAAGADAQRPGARAREVVVAAAGAAREALLRTPEQLPALAAAGVVDAGGRGLVVVLDAAETALTGRRPSPARGRTPIPVPWGRGAASGAAEASDDAARDAGHLDPDGPSYEVMYLLDADDSAVPALRTRLGPLGDSLVVVGGNGLWHVHVHVDDVGAAIEAGIEAGRPHRVRVTHFVEQASARRTPRPAAERAVVAVAAGPGLQSLFEEAGAHVVVPAARRASTAELTAAVEALRAAGSREILLLPNDVVTLRAARVAAGAAEADHEGLRVAVIPTRAQVQGLAAVAVHEPGRAFDADVLEMTATARHARHGGVTIASRRAMTTAGLCEPGQVLGFVDSDVATIGAEIDAVAVDVLGRLLGAGGELVTIVWGAPVPPTRSSAGGAEAPDGSDRSDGPTGPGGAVDTRALAERCVAWVEQQHPTVEVVAHEGGQPNYALLLAVE